jgi:hypothetical protein
VTPVYCQRFELSAQRRPFLRRRPQRAVQATEKNWHLQNDEKRKNHA